MFKYDHNNSRLIGPHGSLSVPAGDQAALKMAMLLQGECTEVGPTRSAEDFNYSTFRFPNPKSRSLTRSAQKKPGAASRLIRSVLTELYGNCFAIKYRAI